MKPECIGALIVQSSESDVCTKNGSMAPLRLSLQPAATMQVCQKALMIDKQRNRF